MTIRYSETQVIVNNNWNYASVGKAHDMQWELSKEGIETEVRVSESGVYSIHLI